MKTLLHIITILLALFALLSASAAEKPNILLILADDLGSGDLLDQSKASGRSRPSHF